MKKYDLAIIGAGSGGLTAAFTAVGFGKSVILIDRNKPGGECTWSGCIPSKALINEAKKVYNVRKYVPEYEYDTKRALEHVNNVIKNVYSHEDPDVLEKAGIRFLQGAASFKNKNTLTVNGEEIRANSFVISTGSAPFVPPIEGLKDSSYLTNESFFELDQFPESMIILGGGAIGVELAQALNRLGVEIELVEMQTSLLFREEEELVQRLERQLEEEGITLHLNTKALKVESTIEGIRLTGDNNGQIKTINGKSILVAIGRKPNIEDLNLDAASISYNRRGIEVNSKMQTSQSHIYAIGDVVGPYQFSHMANVQGIKAVQNALLPFKRKVNYDHVAWVTFTEPELGRAGMTEKEAREKYGDKIRIYKAEFNDLDRARTKGETEEVMKVVLDRKGKILGVSIFGDRAGEMIAEAQVLKTLGHNFAKFGSIIHPYPTYGEVYAKLGKQVMIDNLLNNPFIKLFRKKA